MIPDVFPKPVRYRYVNDIGDFSISLKFASATDIERLELEYYRLRNKPVTLEESPLDPVLWGVD